LFHQITPQIRKNKNGEKNPGRKNGSREKKGRETTWRQGAGEGQARRQTHHENLKPFVERAVPAGKFPAGTTASTPPQSVENHTSNQEKL
jgi:hypothetical protein